MGTRIRQMESDFTKGSQDNDRAILMLEKKFTQRIAYLEEKMMKVNTDQKMEDLDQKVANIDQKVVNFEGKVTNIEKTCEPLSKIPAETQEISGKLAKCIESVNKKAEMREIVKLKSHFEA